MHVERSTTIDRPIEEVFEYVSTPENDPTWVSASLRHERTTPGPMRVGTATEEDVKFLGRTATYTWEVTEYEPPNIVTYRATSGLLPGAVVRLRLEPVEGGTRLTHAVDIEPQGAYYKAMAPLMPWATGRLIERLDRKLKELLEGKATSPPPRRSEAASGLTPGGVGIATVTAILALLLLRRPRRRSER